MSFDWKKSKLFSRNSNVYTFTKNPLFRRNEMSHIYMPWDDKIENGLMYLIKAQINKTGRALIPYMSLDQKSLSLTNLDVLDLNSQIAAAIGETHLVMSNLSSVHIYRVTQVLENLKIGEDDILDDFKSQNYSHWIEVDDLYVLNVNHIDSESDINSYLNDYITTEQVQNIFYNTNQTSSLEKKKWVNTDRSLTYEYFIRSCELQDHIFQSSWDYLSKSAQHNLITSGLQKQKCLFLRDQEKWGHLKSAFLAYQDGLVAELNDIYILPLVSAISKFESLDHAWEVALDGLINKKMARLIQDILDGKSSQINNLDDFLFFTKNAKSFYYSLKNQFTKKFHKEEFLLVENFLGKQESLIDSFLCRDLFVQIHLIQEMENWILNLDETIHEMDLTELKNSNLKLTHLLSIMLSVNYQDNIFFKLLEEKMDKAVVGISQSSFEEEVRNLQVLKIKNIA